MITVTATQLRSQLFEYLDKVTAGETIIIQRNRHQVARLIPMEPSDWQSKMTQTLHVNVTEDELMSPIEDIWEDYV